MLTTECEWCSSANICSSTCIWKGNIKRCQKFGEVWTGYQNPLF